MGDKLLALIMAVAMAVSGGAAEAGNAASQTQTAKPSVEQSEAAVETKAVKFVKKMGIGINLGNTFEACGDWIAQWGDGTVKSYETAWGSPVITENIIKGYANAGFKTLRVPVSWSNMMGENYTISPAYASRVKQVVDWAIDSNMYVIVNLHYDNGWMENFPTKKDECMKRYKRIWTQVSELFKDYDEHLIFEGQNEELGWSSLWNQWGGSKGKAESYALVNEINQTFVDIVRNSGGGNSKRLLLIPGYNTGIETTADPLYKVPKDPAEMLAISCHYYSPSTFAILTEDAAWGKNQYSWGTEKDMKELRKSMELIKTRFVDNGIPVIIGEYGCPTENKDMDSVRLYISSVCEEAYVRGMCPVLWSTPGHMYDRNTCRMMDKEIAESFKKISRTKRS